MLPAAADAVTSALAVYVELLDLTVGDKKALVLALSGVAVVTGLLAGLLLRVLGLPVRTATDRRLAGASVAAPLKR